MKQAAKPIYFLTLVISLFLVMPVHGSIADESEGVSDEYALKAVCLYNFAQFTRWPGALDLKLTDSIVVGVVGQSPFIGAINELQNLLKQANKKNIKVVNHGSYKEGMDLTDSHILFISSSEKKNMRQIVERLKGKPVLTVSDAEGFLEDGGMISLVLLKNKVRWEINRTAIDSTGLQISAKLLQLAIRVEDVPDQSDYHFPYRWDREKPLFALSWFYQTLKS